MLSAMAGTTPTTEKKHVIGIYEHDRSKALVAGKNPVKIAEATIPYEHTMPRRERAAIAAVQKQTGRTPSIAHKPGGDMVATLVIHSALSPESKQQQQVDGGLSEAVMIEALRSPAVQREIARAVQAATARAGRK